MTRTSYTACVHCNEPFSHKNVYSAEGWAETQISGLCEKCFDLILKTEEDDQVEEDDGST